MKTLFPGGMDFMGLSKIAKEESLNLETLFYAAFGFFCLLCVVGTFIFWAYTNRGYDRPYPISKVDTLLWIENHIKGLRAEKRTLEKLPGNNSTELENLDRLIEKYERMLDART